MSKVGNETRLVIALTKERAEKRMVEHKSKNEGPDRLQQRMNYQNGAQMVLDLLDTIPKELEKERR